MKVIGVIPARYASTRFPGKPLADICGKPMIWWVYNQVMQVKEFTEVYVATDDERIAECCRQYGMKFLMTRTDTPNHIHRIWEVTEMIEADYYISINGDEPLISPDNIRAAFPDTIVADRPFFQSVYRELKDPAELMDIANVKIVLNKEGACMYPRAEGSCRADGYCQCEDCAEQGRGLHVSVPLSHTLSERFVALYIQESHRHRVLQQKGPRFLLTCRNGYIGED